MPAYFTFYKMIISETKDSIINLREKKQIECFRKFTIQIPFYSTGAIVKLP